MSLYAPFYYTLGVSASSICCKTLSPRRIPFRSIPETFVHEEEQIKRKAEVHRIREIYFSQGNMVTILVFLTTLFSFPK